MRQLPWDIPFSAELVIRLTSVTSAISKKRAEGPYSSCFPVRPNLAERGIDLSLSRLQSSEVFVRPRQGRDNGFVPRPALQNADERALPGAVSGTV